MRAAVFSGPNIMHIRELKCLQGNENEKLVLLKVNSCSVCGYDAQVFRNGHSKVKPPIILGHEICGEVIQNNTNFNKETIKIGSRVAVSPLVPCLNCWYCNNEQYNMCINLKEIGSTINGGFAEYIRVPQNTAMIGGLVPIPDKLSNEEASLLEPLSCCLNAFNNLIVPSTKEIGSVVIIGDGPIGLINLQLAKNFFGAKSTGIIGQVPLRMQKAKSMGADMVLSFPKNHDIAKIKTILDKVLEFTKGIGADAIIIATSDPAALDFAIKISSKNSKIIIFAGISKRKNTVAIDPNWIHHNQISIAGSFSATPKMLADAVRIASTKEIDLSQMITHRFSLDDIEKAMITTEKFYGLRSVIHKF
ncbi:MAG: alcohol dehydrogenase catalytic domain-containing protein [Candidatus Nitrosocosmicus sp.]